MDPQHGSHSRSEAFIDLLMECRYSAGTVMNGGRKMELKAGQMVGAVSWLAARWNWTPQTVRTWLDKLQDDGMIERSTPGVSSENNKQVGKQASVITVCNYSEYQLIQEPEQQAVQQANNSQSTSTQHASNNNIRKNKGTKEQEIVPPTPLAGGDVAEPEFPGLPVEKPKAVHVRRECDEALTIYNKAAAHFGFAKCENLTDARRKRLAKRLTDVGGVERFRQALRTLAKSDAFTDFLLGKVKPREGEKAFRLDLDRFLQSEGNLGDVIARLLDLSTAEEVRAQDAPWANWDEAEWERQIDMHANGIWPVDKLSPSPASKKTACPPGVIERKRLLERYDENGFSREKH
jgi:hypothetical protein